MELVVVMVAYCVGLVELFWGYWGLGGFGGGLLEEEEVRGLMVGKGY